MLNEVNYFIVRDQCEFIFLGVGVGGGGVGIRGCATTLVTGQYIVLENISTEYYTVRTARSGVSFNQGLARSERSLQISKKQ